MNSKERVLTTFRFIEPDRVPCWCGASPEFMDFAIMGGDWSPFWHDVIDLMGMVNLFIKMYTDPEPVRNIFKKVMDYYMEVNTRIFEEAADRIDIFFIGNDFGSQSGPLLDVSLFNQFISPHLKQLARLGLRKDARNARKVKSYRPG